MIGCNTDINIEYKHQTILNIILYFYIPLISNYSIIRGYQEGCNVDLKCIKIHNCLIYIIGKDFLQQNIIKEEVLQIEFFLG